MTPSLLRRVAERLETCAIEYALIGGVALAVRGVARSTFDVDILVTDPRALAVETWAPVERSELRASAVIRRGDADDPLLGVARLEAVGQRTVDVIVGRWHWQRAALLRAERFDIDGYRLPVARASDLVLLKLYAGGLQDAWDVRQLLALPGADDIVGEVDAALGQLPPAARRLWERTCRGD